jgi:hypothetical protein
MNKLFFSIVLLISFNNSEVIGQTQTKKVPSISFCGASKDDEVIKFDDLLKCHELTLLNSDSKIVSYEVGFNESGLYKTFKVDGNTWDENMVKFLNKKKGTEVKVLFITDVKLDSDNNSDNQIKGLKLKLE